MKRHTHRWRSVATALAAALALIVFLVPHMARAGTTGNITGTVTDAKTGAPVADVQVTAAAPSQTATATTNARGFYSLVNLTPDTYTISFQKTGYQPISQPGVTVLQDQTNTVNQSLQTELKTIATVHAAGASNLVKSNQGSNVYTVTGEQLNAATNPGNLHETLYQYLAVTPGVTGTGFPSQPRVRGGQVTDLGYEFEGIPIQDRITGFFTSNLANIGVSNIEIYTGGLPASGSTNGTGYFNSVLKTGSYPGFTNLFVQATSPEMNHFITFERGGGSPDRKFTYYVGFDYVESQNEYGYGEHTYQNVLYQGFNGPGPVKTRDWVSNFIYRPNQNNALQFVLTNSLGEFNFNYLLKKPSGQPPALAFQPCPGAVNAPIDPNTQAPTTFTGGIGGTAPNGQPCPQGLYFTAIPNGGGNIWHHYGGLGKLQWNHNLNEHSFFNLSFAENFNQYIFDQPWGDPNNPDLQNPGGPYDWAGVLGSTCPTYPYAAGTPVQNPAGDPLDLCAWLDGFAESFWGDRRSNMWIGNFTYTNQLSQSIGLKAGISHERDNNIFNYFVTNFFNGGTPGSPATWPDNYLHSIYPTTEDTVWASTDLRIGHFLLTPGLAYAQEHYGYPNGGKTQHIINPTFNGTYTFDPNNVVRFSYGNTSSFVGAGYVYRESSGTYNPDKAGFSFDPQQNHSADLMFEHQFGNNTSLRIGPWYNKTTNYFEQFTPVTYTNGVPSFGKPVLSNAQAHNAFGMEFGLNHIDTRPMGISYWLSGTYDNYWTTSTSLAGSFVNSPLPQNIIDQGVFVRAQGNPLVSGTLLADFHSNRFHLDPLIYYQTQSFYNIGVISQCTTWVTSSSTTCSAHGGTFTSSPFIAQPEQIAGGYFKVKLTGYEELGPNRNFYLGFTVDNLTDNRNDVTPCNSGGTGCFPFNGPFSGVNTPVGNATNPVYIYQDYTQTPRLFYVFAGVKM